MLPLPLRNVEWLEHSCWFLMFCLYLLTCETLVYELYNIHLHPVPPKPFPKVSIHLGTSRVDCIWRLVSFWQNQLPQLRFTWYTQYLAKPQCAVLCNAEVWSLIFPNLYTNLDHFGIDQLCSLDLFHEGRLQGQVVKVGLQTSNYRFNSSSLHLW